MEQYKNGQVILPLEVYNELLAKIAAAEAEVTRVKNCFTLQKRNWSNSIEIIIDSNYVAQTAKELYTGSVFDGNFTLYNAEDIYNAAITVGDPIPEATLAPEPDPAAEDEDTPTPAADEEPAFE